MNTEPDHVIYEVNLIIDNDIYDAYLTWLTEHIPEILSIDGFTDADIYTPELADEDNDHKHLSVRYKLNTREQLQNYLDNHAQKLRSDGINRFGSKFKAERRILSSFSKIAKK